MSEYTQEFELAWKTYAAPKGSSKLVAFKSWKKLNGSRPSQDLMLASIDAYNQWLADESKKTGREYPKCHFSTWLNQARYEGFEDDAQAILRAKEGHSQADREAMAKTWGDAWDTRFDALEKVIGHEAFCHWFLATTISQCEGKIIVDCPSSFHAQELEKRFGPVLRRTFGDVQLTVAWQKNPRQG